MPACIHTCRGSYASLILLCATTLHRSGNAVPSERQTRQLDPKGNAFPPLQLAANPGPTESQVYLANIDGVIVSE